MNRTEDRLTDALDEAAATVRPETLRPLPEPRPRPGRFGRRHRGTGLASAGRWGTWLAPAAAAVAVTLVVIVALVVTAGTRGSTGGGAAGLRAGERTRSVAGPPRYYAEVEGKFDGWHGPDAVRVVVRSTATGAVVARIANPVFPGQPKVWAVSVAAAPGDRTFYAVYSDNNYDGTGRLLVYRFQIAPSGAATGLTPIRGSLITGQNWLMNVGGFAVSPDGSRLALAVAARSDDNVASAVATEILVIDLRTGAHTIWRGGLGRAGQMFGITDLSWAGDGASLVYLAQWCPPDDVAAGQSGGFGCSALSPGKPARQEGSQVVREVDATTDGGNLDSGPVLLRSSARYPVIAAALVDPDGARLTALLQDSNGSQVVTVSVATGQVTSVLDSAVNTDVPGLYLGADSTGRYLLLWQAGLSVSPVHGWIKGGTLHELAPSFPVGYPGGWMQMAW